MTSKLFNGDPFGHDSNLPRRQSTPAETAAMVASSDEAFTKDRHGSEAGHVDDSRTPLGRQVLEATIHGQVFGDHAFTGVPNYVQDARTEMGREAFIGDLEQRARPK